jgi:hypothetical protein
MRGSFQFVRAVRSLNKMDSICREVVSISMNVELKIHPVIREQNQMIDWLAKRNAQ